MNFVNNLKVLCAVTRMSEERLSRKSAIPLSVIQSWKESDKIQPSLEELEKIRNVFKIPYDLLLRDDFKKTVLQIQKNNERYIEDINQMLKPYGLRFTLACYDLRYYTPTLEVLSHKPYSKGGFNGFNISCSYNSEEEGIRFFLRSFTFAAENVKEYYEACRRFKELNFLISECERTAGSIILLDRNIVEEVERGTINEI